MQPAPEPKEEEGTGKMVMGIAASAVVLCSLIGTVFLGLITTTVAIIIFAVFIAGLLIFASGGASLALGLSDTEGDAQREEEEEQRKAEEAEYYGEHHDEHE